MIIERPLVSIIIATFNRANTVVQTINSVLNQTYAPIEIIIVDDGSTDGTSSVLVDAFGLTIRLITLERNQGATNARNQGLLAAKGLYAIVWDSDDLLYANAVERLVAKAQEHPDVCTISAPTKVYKNNTLVSFEKIPEGFLTLEKIVCANMPKYKLVRMSKTEAHSVVLYRGKNLDFMVNNELAAYGSWYHTDQDLGDHFLLSDEHSLTSKRRKLNAKNSILRSEILVEHIERFKHVYLQHCARRYTDYAYGATLGLILGKKKSKAQALAREAWRVQKGLRNGALVVLAYTPANHLLLRLFYR
jgi:glycosyltransferase involved in cell wall biosynthesis